MTSPAGLPRSTTFRILNQLVQLGWLDHGPGRYRIGVPASRPAWALASPHSARSPAAPCWRISEVLFPTWSRTRRRVSSQQVGECMAI